MINAIELDVLAHLALAVGITMPNHLDGFAITWTTGIGDNHPKLGVIAAPGPLKTQFYRHGLSTPEKWVGQANEAKNKARMWQLSGHPPKMKTEGAQKSLKISGESLLLHPLESEFLPPYPAPPEGSVA